MYDLNVAETGGAENIKIILERNGTCRGHRMTIRKKVLRESDRWQETKRWPLPFNVSFFKDSFGDFL
jgi:hypothetical protein